MMATRLAARTGLGFASRARVAAAASSCRIVPTLSTRLMSSYYFTPGTFRFGKTKKDTGPENSYHLFD
jgi:hypothetical protein